MTSPRLTLLIALLGFVALCLLCWAIPVGAQTGCPVGGSITLPDGFSVNVRSGPGSTFPTVRNAVRAGETLTVLEVAKDSDGRNWWRVGAGQWVISSYWIIVCPINTNTPVPTATKAGPTPTPTPSRIPTSTPTIAGLQTITPHPTVNPYMVYDYGSDGKLDSITVYCFEPCSWTVHIENLP